MTLQSERTAPRPKNWVELNQKQVIFKEIKWDDIETEAAVVVPPARKSVLIAIDNQLENVLTATFAQHIRTDDTNAEAEIKSKNDTEILVIAHDVPGAAGNEYLLKVAIPPVSEPPEATDLKIELVAKVIVITLAITDAPTPMPNDAKNTVNAIVAAINDAETGIKGFTASNSGDGDGIFDAATGEPIHFTGGTTDMFANFYGLDDEPVSIVIPAETCRVYGPFKYFPRFLGGKITLTADEAPGDGGITTVQVQEI